MSHSSKKRSPARLFLILFLLAAGAAGVYWGQGTVAKLGAPPAMSLWAGPTPVRVVQAQTGSLALWLRAIGTVTPLATVTVRPRVEGELVEVLFSEGQAVKAGQLLARIDARPYQIALSQAEGQQQQNLAQLKNAQLDLQRYQTLYKQDSVSRQQLDSQEALVRQYQGTTQIDQARVDDARLQLSYTRITAPIAGRIGLRAVDVGNVVSSGSAEGLAVITQMQPMSVVFAIPETRLAEVRAALRASPALRVEAWDRNAQTRLAEGTLSTLDNRIDTATGTVRLRADFANADEALFPNQFLNVRLHVRSIEDALVIPGDAVQYGANGAYVYVITGEARATVRPVTLGASDDGQVVVLAGLQAGESVAIEGLDRLREGRAVQVVEGVSAERAPPPAPSRPPSGGAWGTGSGRAR